MSDSCGSAPRSTVKSASLFVGALTLGAISVALGQQQENQDEEIITLSPFTVDASDDVGYTATQSQVGGRLSTSLMETPVSVQVMNGDFLSDIGADDVREATRYALNVVHEEESGGNLSFNDYNVSVRGMPERGFQTRNFFQWIANSPTAFTERLDFSRGPNGVVFGSGSVSGILNVSSKRARVGGTIRSLNTKFYGDGGYLASFDYNQTITDEFAIRGVAVKEDRDFWRDGSGRELEGLYLTFTWKPTKQTTIWAEGEIVERSLQIVNTPIDQWSNWDGTLWRNAAGAVAPAPVGTQPDASATGLYIIGDDSGRRATDRGGLRRSTGSGRRAKVPGLGTQLAGTPWDPAALDWETTIWGNGPGFRKDHSSVSLFIEHQVNDNLFLEAAANHHEQEIDNHMAFYDIWRVDVNMYLADGVTPNPYAGQFYAEGAELFSSQSNELDTGRVAAAYLFDTDFLSSSHKLYAGVEVRRDVFNNMPQEWLLNDDSTRSWQQRRVQVRRYFSDNGSKYVRPETIEGSNLVRERTGQAGTLARRKSKSFSIASNSTWLEGGRLTTLVGARWEEFTLEEAGRTITSPEQLFESQLPYELQQRQNVSTITAGATYKIIDDVALYANYSEAFREGRNGGTINDPDNSTLPPLLGDGTEFGVHFKLFAGKVSGSLAYYRNELVDVPLAWRTEHQFINVDVFRAWDDLLLAANPSSNPSYEANSTLGTGAFMEVNSFEATGFELDITANLARNWTLAYNIAFPRTKASAGARFSRAWLEENRDYILSEAQVVDAALGTTQGTDLALAGIANFQEAIDSAGAPGRKLDGSYDYTSNLFTNYRFSDGPLKGFSVGGGANIRGKRIIGNLPDDLFSYVYQPSRITLNARFGYAMDLGRNVKLTLQLNVNNILDEQYIEPISFTDIAAREVRDYTVFEPRTVDLTARFDF